MAQHKAPTEVTIAAREERSEFGAWVERNWKLMAALAILVAVAILTLQYLGLQRREALSQSWNRVWNHAEPTGTMAFFDGGPVALGAVYPEVAQTPVGPWALYLEAKLHAEERQYEAGVAALLKLQSNHPEHPLVVERFSFAGQETPLSVVENLLQALRAQGAWEKGREFLFDNPAPPADAPKVRLTTSEGDIVVQVYPELAPKHGDNFLKLTREGYYDGTRFHRVEPGFMIQGGDPNSKEDDRSLWGLGGPEYKVDREENDLRHFTGYLAAAKTPGSIESSGSQFYITVAPAHHLDGEHVIFGKVIEGMDVAHKIERGQLDTNPMRRGQPIEPVTLLSASVQ